MKKSERNFMSENCVKAEEVDMSVEKMVFDLAMAAVQNHNPSSFSIPTLIDDFVVSYKRVVEPAMEEEVKEEWTKDNCIQDDFVVCLECGAKMSQLTGKHLKFHKLTMEKYKAKWGFKKTQKFSCLSLKKKRSKAAKKRGVPAGLLAYSAAKKAANKDAPVAVEKKETKKKSPVEEKKATPPTRRRQPAPPVEEAQKTNAA